MSDESVSPCLMRCRLLKLLFPALLVQYLRLHEPCMHIGRGSEEGWEGGLAVDLHLKNQMKQE